MSDTTNFTANLRGLSVIEPTPSCKVNVSVAEEQIAPSKITNLGRDHLQYLHAGKEDCWRSCFEFAAVVELHLGETKYISFFEPSERLLQTA